MTFVKSILLKRQYNVFNFNFFNRSSLGYFSKLNCTNNLKMKSINHNVPVKCSKAIAINASSEKVWAVMTNINNWANWLDFLKTECEK